jgi:hypothetical protein
MPETRKPVKNFLSTHLSLQRPGYSREAGRQESTKWPYASACLALEPHHQAPVVEPLHHDEARICVARLLPDITWAIVFCRSLRRHLPHRCRDPDDARGDQADREPQDR